MEIVRADEWQCRYVFPDRRCCLLPKDHQGEHNADLAALLAERAQQANPETLRATFTNEVIRAIGALARQQTVCREQGGHTVFVAGMDAAREYIVEHVQMALSGGVK